MTNLTDLTKAVSAILRADTTAKNAGNKLLVTLAATMDDQTIEALYAVKIELYRAKDWKVKGQKFGTEAEPKTIQVYFSTFKQALNNGLELSAYTEIHALKEAIKVAKGAATPKVATESEAAEPVEQGEGTKAFTENETVDDGEGGHYDIRLPEGRLVAEALPEWFNEMAGVLLALRPSEQDQLKDTIVDAFKVEVMALAMERKKAGV